jgi:hypothetical protein
MIQSKLRSLRDQDLKNSLGRKTLVQGQIFVHSFKNEQELEALLNTGKFELVQPEVPEKKSIPVVPPGTASNELLNTLELCGNLDKLSEEST